MGIPCGGVAATATSLALTVPAVKGALKGTVSADGNSVEGTWSQGVDVPIVLTRQDKAIEAVQEKIDPAMPPVDVAKIQSVLAADLAAALASGNLAPATEAGITIGVLQHSTGSTSMHPGASGTAARPADTLFRPEGDFAIVVLSNTSAADDDFTDKRVRHIVQRLTGLPSESLDPLPTK